MSVRTATTHTDLMPPDCERVIEAWHFAREGGQCGQGITLHVRPGETMSVTGAIVPCAWGLHGSVRAIDALKHAPGSIVSRVLLWGDLAPHKDNKHAARHRHCLWQADATTALWLYACDEVEPVLLAEREAGREPHADTWAAVRVRRAWLDGNATDADLQAADRAAYLAACQSAANERLERVLTALGPGGEA